MDSQIFSYNINLLDLFVGIVTIMLVLRGVWTGFSRSVATFAGLIAGLWVAVHKFPLLEVRLAPWIHNDVVRSLTAFLMLFLLVHLFFLIGGILANSLLKAIRLGWMDRVLGGMAGLLKGIILAGALAFFLTVFLPAGSPIIKDSHLYPVMSQVAQVMGSMVPSHLKGRFMWKWRKLQQENSARSDKAV